MVADDHHTRNGLDGAPLLPIARHYVERGLSVAPVLADGSKRPAVAWEQFQTRPPTDAELVGWFGGMVRRGIAIIGGAVSLHLLILDFETGAAYERWLERVYDFSSSLLDGSPIARTPASGYHVYLRCREPVPGNAKLAMSAEPSRGKSHVLIETRGEGGCVVAPGSPAECHKTGLPYTWHARGWIDDDHEPLSLEALCTLLDVARSLDERPKRPAQHQSPAVPPAGPVQASRYGRGALRKILGRLVSARFGNRNDSLNEAAFAVGQLAGGGELDGAAAADELHACGLALGLAEREVVATIRSGLTAGAKSPRSAPR